MPGSGIVARLTHAVGCAAGSDAGLGAVLTRLSALDDAEWPEIVRTITADIVDAGYENFPAIALAAPIPAGLATLVFGDIQLVAVVEGEETVLDGRDATTWVDMVLHGEVTEVAAGVSTETGLIGVLRGGVVAGGGFVLDVSAGTGTRSDVDTAAAVETAVEETVVEETPESPVGLPKPPRVVQEDAGSGMFEQILERTESPAAPSPGTDVGSAVVDELPQAENPAAPVTPMTGPVTGPVEPVVVEPIQPPTESPTSVAVAVPTTQLRGVRCPDGHLTSIQDHVCRTCGQMPAPEAEIAVDVRPVLGVITFDDGAVLPLNRPAIIGSEMPNAAELAGEPATLVRLDDGVGGVDAMHLQVHLVGWNVEIVDLGTTSGTFVSPAGDRPARMRLRPNQPTTLTSGTVVEVGARTFTFSVGPSPLPA